MRFASFERSLCAPEVLYFRFCERSETERSELTLCKTLTLIYWQTIDRRRLRFETLLLSLRVLEVLYLKFTNQSEAKRCGASLHYPKFWHWIIAKPYVVEGWNFVQAFEFIFSNEMSKMSEFGKKFISRKRSKNSESLSLLFRKVTYLESSNFTHYFIYTLSNACSKISPIQISWAELWAKQTKYSVTIIEGNITPKTLKFGPDLWIYMF